MNGTRICAICKQEIKYSDPDALVYMGVGSELKPMQGDYHYWCVQVAINHAADFYARIEKEVSKDVPR